jgi:hypothetical protein
VRNVTCHAPDHKSHHDRERLWPLVCQVILECVIHLHCGVWERLCNSTASVDHVCSSLILCYHKQALTLWKNSTRRRKEMMAMTPWKEWKPAFWVLNAQI